MYQGSFIYILIRKPVNYSLITELNAAKLIKGISTTNTL